MSSRHVFDHNVPHWKGLPDKSWPKASLVTTRFVHSLTGDKDTCKRATLSIDHIKWSDVSNKNLIGKSEIDALSSGSVDINRKHVLLKKTQIEHVHT